MMEKKDLLKEREFLHMALYHVLKKNNNEIVIPKKIKNSAEYKKRNFFYNENEDAEHLVIRIYK